MKLFVLVSKVLPMVLALCHLLNYVFGYFGWNNVIAVDIAQQMFKRCYTIMCDCYREH